MELAHSTRLAGDEIPVLISPKLLRTYDCGQVDLASFQPQRKLLTLFEVKSSGRVSARQWKRLKRSATFLGTLLDSACFCRILAGL